MAAPTTTNEVTARRLSDVITGTWGKVKELAVSDVAWDSTNSKLTKTKNGTTSDVVTKSTLLSALGGSIADGNTGFVTGDAAYDALALKANLASPTLTGTPKAPTAAAGTNTTQIATTAFVKTAVDNAIATADALTYKGTVDGGSTGEYGALTPAASKGDVYKVSVAGKIDGIKVEVGDMLVCNTDSTAAATASNYSTIVANWDFIQTNIDGAVTSSSSSVTANTVAIFDGTTGKIIKTSGYTIGKSVPSNAVFTDASVTAVGNHYSPATDSSAEKDASGGTATQLPTSSGTSNVQVVTGITMDAKGHVTGVVSKGLWSPNTTYSSQAAAAGGTTNSLCTTGEKYTWNNKQDAISDLATIRAQAGGAVRYDAAQTLDSTQQAQARSNIGAGTSNLELGTTASTAAKGNHTHTASIATDSSTSGVTTLSANSQYKLTAGGSSVIFKTPADTTYTFDGTYDASSNKAATVSSVTSRINALDVTVSGCGAGKTLATLTETDGKIAATFQNILISKSQVSDFSHTHGNIANDGTLSDTAAAAAGNDYVVIRDADNNKIQTSTIKGTDVADAVSKRHGHSSLTLSTTAQKYDGSHTLALPSTDPYTSARTPSSHTHGNITNDGAITTSGALANGDALIFAASDESDKLKKSSITFDGSTTNQCLTKAGTWATFASSNTDTKVKATAKTDNVNYKILATASASPTSGGATEAVYDTDITLNPSTNTIAANISGNASSASAAASGSALETAINGKVSTSTTVNGHALTGNVTVTAADVGAVRYDTASQGLSDTQKSNARTNIGAGTSNLALGTSSTTAAKGDHTHTTSIATSTGTNQITLAASTKYAITAGGTSYVFTTPPNTTYSSKTAASGGTDVSLCTTGEKYTWNSKQDALTEMTETEVTDLLAALT